VDPSPCFGKVKKVDRVKEIGLKNDQNCPGQKVREI